MVYEGDKLGDMRHMGQVKIKKNIKYFDFFYFFKEKSVKAKKIYYISFKLRE